MSTLAIIKHTCVSETDWLTWILCYLGITALEMAEGKPPYGDIHPMRAIFMIPTRPPPSFRDPNKWSQEFTDFVSLCLVKQPEKRATAKKLLQVELAN